MRAPYSPFESYKSKRILFFANIFFPSDLAPKGLNKRGCVIFNCSGKLQNIFEIGLTKCEVIVQKSLSEKISRNKQVKVATVLIWGQSTNSIWVVTLLSVCFKRKKFAGVAGRRKQKKICGGENLHKWYFNPTFRRYRTYQKSLFQHRCYRYQVPKYLQNLSLLLIRSFCALDTIVTVSFARPTFASLLTVVYGLYMALITE